MFILKYLSYLAAFLGITTDDASVEIIRIHGDISLMSLTKKYPILLQFIDCNWYASEAWASTPIAAGKYVVRLRCPGSKNIPLDQKILLLTEEEKLPPIALAILAFLSAQEDGHDPYNDTWVYCAETTKSGLHVMLYWGDGQFLVGASDGKFEGGASWLASCRKF